jgi:II/X family phage/plasmid replication protein
VIDWLWMRVPLASAVKVKAGCVIAFDPSGEQEWMTEKWLEARGSHDGKMAVRRSEFDHAGELPTPTCLDISGCPAKFFQGHNIFGTDDIKALGVATIARVIQLLDLEVTGPELDRITDGIIQLCRVDINYMYSCGSLPNVKAWLRAAETGGYLSGRGRGLMNQGTVRWPEKKSRHWNLKGYAKGQEIQAPKHQLPEALRGRGLEEFAADKLRLELTMLSRYLRSYDREETSCANSVGGYAILANWHRNDPQRIFSAHLSRLQLSGQMTLAADDLDGMPTRLRTAYLAWKSGDDLRAALPDRTFFRYRKHLLPFGVDIAVKVADPLANVVPLVRTIEAKPVDVPSWAIGTDLYYEPPRRNVAA